MLLLRVLGRRCECYGEGFDLFDSDSARRLGDWIPLQALSQQQQLTAAVNIMKEELYAFRRDLSRLSTFTSS